MPKFSFSIRTLLFVVVVVAIYFPVQKIYEPRRRNRLQVTHQIFSDFETLSRISEGDSIEAVTRHYPMLAVVEPDSSTWEELAVQFKSAELIVKPTDEFYGYTLHGQGMFGYLQFRNGRLVNHPKALFGDPVANTLRSGANLPTLFERMGVWPIYLAIVGLLCAIFVFSNRAFQRNQTKSGDSLNAHKTA